MKEEKKKGFGQTKNSKNKVKPDNFDTQTLLKRRLQRIILVIFAYETKIKIK